MPQLTFPQSPALPFVELQSVDSTNNYAFAQIHAGLAHHGSAFFAHEQVRGKGQRGKLWKAERDANIILSIVINPKPLLLSQQFQLSACVAVSAWQLFKQYAGDDTAIKWPNDIYWQDRKAGGILVEGIVGKKEALWQVTELGQSSPGTQDTADWKWAIAGMGININQVGFPEELKNPVSLKQITGKDHDPFNLAKELYLILNKNLTDLIANGFDNIYDLYVNCLYKKDKTVKFKKGSRVFNATVKKVTKSGSLLVQHSIEEEFNFGELEWLHT